MAGCVMVATLGLVTAPVAGADTINEMVENTGALEMPFWSYLYESGFGYLDAQRVNNDGKIACANRTAGVPPDQIAPLLASRGYTEKEAWGIVLAEQSGQDSVHSVC
jgi:hypothetical protein